MSNKNIVWDIENHRMGYNTKSSSFILTILFNFSIVVKFLNFRLKIRLELYDQHLNVVANTHRKPILIFYFDYKTMYAIEKCITIHLTIILILTYSTNRSI